MNAPPEGIVARVFGAIGAFCIHAWLWIVGRRMPVDAAPYLDGPVGPPKKIGVALYAPEGSGRYPALLAA